MTILTALGESLPREGKATLTDLQGAHVAVDVLDDLRGQVVEHLRLGATEHKRHHLRAREGTKRWVGGAKGALRRH